jgi:hypothetical protein
MTGESGRELGISIMTRLRMTVFPFILRIA